MGYFLGTTSNTMGLVAPVKSMASMSFFLWPRSLLEISSSTKRTTSCHHPNHHRTTASFQSEVVEVVDHLVRTRQAEQTWASAQPSLLLLPDGVSPVTPPRHPTTWGRNPVTTTAVDPAPAFVAAMQTAPTPARLVESVESVEPLANHDWLPAQLFQRQIVAQFQHFVATHRPVVVVHVGAGERWAPGEGRDGGGIRGLLSLVMEPQQQDLVRCLLIEESTAA
jgi:hypothetical protein